MVAKLTEQLNSSLDNIYKICIYNSQGVISHIILFNNLHSNKSHRQNKHTFLFNNKDAIKDIPLLDINQSTPIIIETNATIHFDDSVHIVKKKILKCIAEKKPEGIDMPVYDELYLFAYTREQYTLKQLYLSAIGASSISMSHDILLRVFDKMGISQHLQLDKQKQEYSFEDFEKMVYDTGKNVFMKNPIGIVMENEYIKTGFEANPYLVENNAIMGELNTGIQYLENRLLLNSTEIANNTLYLCIASSVFNFIETKENYNEIAEHISSKYFRYLFYKGIKNGEQLEGYRAKLAEETEKMLDPKIFQIYDSIQLLYDIHKYRKTELEYEERGIKYIQFRIQNNNKTTLPLDTVFKNVHASKMIPFILYNPSSRRENIYRLYYESLSKTGNKIPFLDTKTLIRLGREMGKFRRQISMYIVEYETNEEANIAKQTMQLNLEQNGSITVFYTPNKNSSIDTINTFLEKMLNQVIQQLNGFLKQTGFYILPFKTIDSPNIQIIDMKWEAKITQNGMLKHSTLGCLRSIFDIKNENMENLKMTYTRVENYVEMTPIDSYISQKYRSHNDKDEIANIISGLYFDFQLSIDEAKEKMANFLSKHGYISGMVANNAGFNASLSVIKDIHSFFLFQIENITSIKYIKCIEIYVDSIIRIIQNIKSTHISKTEIEEKCKLSKSTINKATELATSVAEIAKTMTADTTATTNILTEYNKPLNEYIALNPSTEIDNIVDIDNIDDINNIELNAIDDADDDIISFIEDYEEIDDNVCDKKNTGECDDIYGDGYIEDTDDINFEEIVQPSSFLNNNNEKINIKNNIKNEAPAEESDEDYAMFMDGGNGSDKENNSEESSGDIEDEFQANPTGMSLHPSPFLRRMMQRDPALFKTTGKNNDSEYTRKCQPIGRYPVSLTQSEKDKIDRESPNSYSTALEYGTDEKHKHYYICPRFWCLKTNTSMTEEEVKSGKCGKIIPDKVPDNKVPEGHYVYEFKRKNPFDKNGNYVQHHAGLFTISGRKYALPCCYKTGNTDERTKQESIKMSIRMGDSVAKEEEEAGKNKKTKLENKEMDMDKNRQSQYIIKMETIPIDQDRWGYLPIVAQLFFNMNYSKSIDKNNPSFILPNKPVLLRYGIERSSTQSFIALLAEIYTHKQKLGRVPTITQMKKILANAITLDIFVKTHNASFISTFLNEKLPKLNVDYIISTYGNGLTKFIDTIDLTNSKQTAFMINAVMAYENFINYINNTIIEIDHSYLWPFITEDIPDLIPNGMNLVLLNNNENDITPHIGLVCPSILSSKQIYDPNKDTVIVLKQDNYYEPIYLYELINDTGTSKIKVIRTFNNDTLNKNIKSILENVQNITNSSCKPLPSMPHVYNFSMPINIFTILQEIKKIKYEPSLYVKNFNGKIIGVIVSPINTKNKENDGKNIGKVFIPCYPTVEVKNTGVNIPTVFMDTLDIWTDYLTTRDTLEKIYRETNEKVKCNIRFKVVDDGLVVGFITETKQFIQINPPVENVYDDNIEVYNNTNLNDVDIELATNSSGDTERIERIALIELETNFFYCFKSIVRELLNDYTNRTIKQQILNLITANISFNETTTTTQNSSSSVQYSYLEKMDKLVEILKKIVSNKIRFMEMDTKTVDELAKIVVSSTDEETDFCIKINLNGDGIAVFPKWHLFNELKTDNELLYFARIADELIRNERARLLLLDSNKYLNIKNLEYKINPNEFIIIQSALTNEYLNSLERAFVKNDYLQNITYDNAYPIITQKYDNYVNLEDQYIHKQIQQTQLLYKIRGIIGNDRSIWKRIFSTSFKEYQFNNTINGAYDLIEFIITDYMKQYKEVRQTFVDILGNDIVDVDAIKRLLFAGYMRIKPYWQVVFDILNKQGKQLLIMPVRDGKMEFEDLIYSSAYSLSDMDIWVLAHAYNLPIIMFNPNGLKGIYFKGGDKQTVSWLKMGGDLRMKFYFIRTLLDSTLNKVSTYNLIYPSAELSKLGEFNTMLRDAYITNSEYTNNVVKLDAYLENIMPK